MKILLFNLGTIEHRLINWELDGFKAIFEQDVILWGPVPDKQFVYIGKEVPILRVFEQISVTDLFEQLPEGWFPDIVTCDTSVINYVPDIYKCPAKTLLFTRDSWSDAVFNRGLVEFFNFLNTSTVDRSVYEAYHVNMLPLRGFAVSTPGHDSHNSEFEKREIDVIAIANYDSAFYHERHKVFYKLSALAGTRFRINFIRSIKRSEIYNYYQRSKIIIDWAHTLSNRSYEAALNGCLLFSHEDNNVISEFWVPWEEYIPYNENNLYELISRYLNNPELSKLVAGKAHKKISTLPATWGEMVWDRICAAHSTEISVQNRIEYNDSLSQSLLQYRTATPLIYNYDYGTDFPKNWRDIYFERINKAITQAIDEDEIILPLIEASRVAFLLRRTEKAFSYLEHLRKSLPNYAWTYYLKARLAFEQNEYDQALDLLIKAVEYGRKSPALLQRFILPVIEKGNTCDGRRITNFMWQSGYKHNNEYQVRALFHLSYELFGFIYEHGGERQKAIDSYSEAIGQIAVPDCIHRLSPLLIESKNYTKLSEVTQKGLEDSPYDTILILYRVYSLILTRKKREAADLLKRHRAALKGFVGIRQITLIRIITYVMIPLGYIAPRTCSFMIIQLIKRLKGKLGSNYLV